MNTDEEQLQHPPPDISGEDWTWLVQCWGRAEAKDIFEKNKANRSQQVIKHTGGTKSFAFYRDEETKFRELNETQEEEPSNSIGDDIYTQVMGAEWHGRVRGYGWVQCSNQSLAPRLAS